MNFLTGGSAGRTNKPVVPAAGLRVQSAVNGTPIPIVHGQQRLAGTLIDYFGFAATPVPAQGGGKGLAGGGGKGSAGAQSYTYTVDMIMGLCEGPVDQVLGLWNNKTPDSLAALNFTAADGAVGQNPWPYMTAGWPQRALGYSALADVIANPIALGNSPELPNLNWEVRGAIANAVQEVTTLTAPYQFTPSYWSLDNSVTEDVTVPAVAPYQIEAANPEATNALPVVLGAINAASIPGSASQGVIYTLTGTPFSRVTGTPTAGQYTLTTGGLTTSQPVATYSFAAADAGAQVTIIDLALSPGVNYVLQPTGNTTNGSNAVTGVSSLSGLTQGQLVTSTVTPVGTVIQDTVSSGSFTGNASIGSPAVSNLSISSGLGNGTPITDSASVFPSGTTILSFTPASVTLSGPIQAPGQLGDGITFAYIEEAAGQLEDSGDGTPDVIYLPGGAPAHLSVGATVLDTNGYISAGTTVTGINTIGSGYINISPAASNIDGGSNSFTFTSPVATTTADAYAGALALTNIGSVASVVNGLNVIDTAGVILSGTTVVGVTAASLVLSANATANHTGDTFSFPNTIVLSNAATATATGVTFTFLGVALTQVLGTPLAGEFSVSVQAASYGQYQFAAADTGKIIIVTDVPDADPAASLTDYLSNPRYGVGFPAANIGNLTLLQDYAFALGLFISPAIVAAQAASSYLNDFATGLNGEFVWSGGLLTFVPYGDVALTGNGKTYTPPLAAGPIDSLGDDDFLPNEGTASIGVSAFTSDDPVICVRTRQSDALNDVKVEYLDRGNSYNPAIVEAQDDAAINLFGLRPADTKTLHFFCSEAAALMSANLQLGRQQVRNQYSVTVPWYFILLDPMDIIAITDAGLGLSAQLVRITEITENQEDWSLTITAEEVLDGTGSAPQYSAQPKLGAAPNYNSDPGALAQAVIFEPPPALSGNTLETLIMVAGGANFGGCDVWIASDESGPYKNLGRIQGGSRIGALQADFPSAGDPDTTDTLDVTLAGSGGTLLGGSQSDADLGHTLCYLAAASGYELVSYETSQLVASNEYALGTYIRRGQYGTTISDHPAAASFARLDGSGLSVPYTAAQLGTTLFIKLTPFNLWGGGEYGLEDVTAIAHVIAGPPAPATIANFAAQVSGGAVVFAWSDPPYAAATLTYDILYGPQGGAITSATLLTRAARSTEMTNASVPPGAWTFYIRGHDTLSGLTGPAATVTLAVPNVNVVLDTQNFAPDWLANAALPSSGYLVHYTGVLVPDSAKLANALTSAALFTQFVPFPAAPTIGFTPPPIDLGFNGNFRIWANWSAASGGGNANENAEITLAAQLWQTGGSAGGAVLIGTSAEITNQRYIQFEVVEATAVPAFISSFTITIDAEPQTYAITNFPVAAAGTALSFAGAAATPPLPAQFRALPNVQVTPTSAGAVSAAATAVSVTGCTITLYDGSGTAVSGSANILITGV